VHGEHGVPLSALQPVGGADGDAGVDAEVGQEPGDAVDGLVVPGDHGHVVGGQGPGAVVGGEVLADKGLCQLRYVGVQVHRVVPVDLDGLDLLVTRDGAVGSSGVEGEVVQRGDRLDGAGTEAVGGRQVQHLRGRVCPQHVGGAAVRRVVGVVEDGRVGGGDGSDLAGVSDHQHLLAALRGGGEGGAR